MSQVVVISKSPKLHITIECPVCNDNFNKAVNVEHVKCLKCKNTFKPDLKMRIFTFYLPIIYRKLESLDEVHIYATNQLKHHLLMFKEHFINMNMFELEGVEQHRLEDPYYYCNSCGTCKTCLTCVSCNYSFEPNKSVRKIHKKDGSISIPRTKCPKCGGTTFKSRLISGESVSVCPTCNEKLKHTKSLTKVSCPKCGKDNMLRKSHQVTNRLIIRKLRAFRNG